MVWWAVHPKVLGALLLGAWHSTWWTDAIRDFGDSNMRSLAFWTKRGGLVVVRVLFGIYKTSSSTVKARTITLRFLFHIWEYIRNPKFFLRNCSSFSDVITWSPMFGISFQMLEPTGWGSTGGIYEMWMEYLESQNSSIPKYPDPSKLAKSRTEKHPDFSGSTPFHWRVQWSLGMCTFIQWG